MTLDCAYVFADIEKLIRMQLDDSKDFDETGKEGFDKQEGEEIKNQYDKRIYELDLFKNILSKIVEYDYRYPRGIKQSSDQEINHSTEADSSD